MNLPEEVSICAISDHYEKALASLSEKKKLDSIEYDKNKISEAIYFHLCKMKYSGWKHRINFKRHKKHTIAEFFQDIIAYYLNVTLPNEYEIILEKKVKNTQPDILIKKNDKNHFIIELKTNIGWNRPQESDDNPYKEFEDRIRNLSSNFGIPDTNIIYIFEEHSNVSKQFSNYFWDSDKKCPEKRSEKFPFSVIYPLFNGTDPYYWKQKRGFKRTDEFINLSDKDILEMAKNNIVTPFESIIKVIQK